ncbi:MAG: lytic transglycosylase domain-containing protein, partial [Bryobacteraceae bacterium]|nr:lytic transglycosylase domain-containing protein [Bryobacteraceae bacterium]
AASMGVGYAASLVHQSGIAPHVRSVVRTDAHGRLVRTVVVSSRLIAPRVVERVGEPGGNASPIRPVAESDLTIPELVESTAKRYDVDPLLVHSVIQVESGYKQHAVSPKGAQGMMQLMPQTARRFGVTNSFDARENIEGGVRYLKYLQSLFPDDTRLAIAAYNAGEGAVWKYNNQIPPYRETEQYVLRVGQRYGKARREAEKKQANLQAAAAKPSSPGPVYSPVQYFVDEDGRLHMQTVEASPESQSSEPKTF